MARFRFVAATLTVFLRRVRGRAGIDGGATPRRRAARYSTSALTHRLTASSTICSARFRNDTLRIFEKHGMENVGYLSLDRCASLVRTRSSTSSRTTAATPRRKSWAAFREDPEWKGVALSVRRRTGPSFRTSSLGVLRQVHPTSHPLK